MTSLPSQFQSREVTLHHFLSRESQLLSVTTLSSSNLPKTGLIDLQPLRGDFR